MALPQSGETEVAGCAATDGMRLGRRYVGFARG